MHQRDYILGVLGVLGVWSLANGRLERPKNRGLCAGKRQAATLEQQGQRLCARKRQVATLEAQAYGHRAWWNSKGSQQGLVEAAATDLKHLRGFQGLELGKRQA